MKVEEAVRLLAEQVEKLTCIVEMMLPSEESQFIRIRREVEDILNSLTPKNGNDE